MGWNTIDMIASFCGNILGDDMTRHHSAKTEIILATRITSWMCNCDTAIVKQLLLLFFG